jgi:hypothetical protein
MGIVATEIAAIRMLWSPIVVTLAAHQAIGSRRATWDQRSQHYLRTVLHAHRFPRAARAVVSVRSMLPTRAMLERDRECPTCLSGRHLPVSISKCNA